MTSPATNISGFNMLFFLEFTDHATVPQFQRFRWSLSAFGSYPVFASGLTNRDGAYIGCASVGNFRVNLGSFTDTKVTYSRMTISLSRDTLEKMETLPTIEDIRDNGPYLLDYDVYVYKVSTDDELPTASNLFFIGRITEGGVTIRQEGVTIECADRRASDTAKCLREKFEDAASIATEWRDKPKPLLLGSWNSGDCPGQADSGFWLEAPVISTANYGSFKLRCQLSVPNDSIPTILTDTPLRWLDSGGAVKGNSTAALKVLYDTGDDALNMIFSILNSDATTFSPLCYDFGTGEGVPADEREWRDGDTILVESVQGPLILLPTTPITASFSNPIAFIYFLLTDSVVGLGLTPATDLDLVSFYDAFMKCEEDQLGFKARRWLKDDALCIDLIGEICRDFCFRLYVKGGKYYIRYLLEHMLFTDTAIPLIRQAQINSWEEYGDKQNIGARNVDVDYNWSPKLDKFISHHSETTAADESNVFSLKSNWIYSEASDVAGMLQLILNPGNQWLVLDMDFTALDFWIGDVVEIEWENGRGFYLITDIDFSFDSPSAKVTVFGAPPLGPLGLWADAEGEACPEQYGGGVVPHDYDAANEVQKGKLALWTDDDDVDPKPKLYGMP